MAAEIEIYGLYDPVTMALRYIWKATNAARRLKTHLHESRRQTPLYDWIRSLRRKSLVPVMRVIQRCPEFDWMRCEKQLIFEARLSGERLLNLAEGGNAPLCPLVVRQRNAAALNRKVDCDPLLRRVREIRLIMGTAIRQGLVSNEIRAKLRQSARKRPDLFGLWLNLPDREETSNA